MELCGRYNLSVHWKTGCFKRGKRRENQLRTLQSENEDGNLDVGTWKSVHFACAKLRKTILESSVARDGREKVICDVLMKTCNILSKIMVILDIHGIKVFCSWISYNFFRVHFERLSVYQVFCMFFWFVYFFLHLSSVESGWKSRRMKVFYFVNQFLVCMFDLSHSTCFFNCFFNF